MHGADRGGRGQFLHEVIETVNEGANSVLAAQQGVRSGEVVHAALQLDAQLRERACAAAAPAGWAHSRQDGRTAAAVARVGCNAQRRLSG